MQILLDNSRIHTSKKVKEWAAEKHLKVLFLHKYSPDLNFIELVWAQLKHKIQSEECKSLRDKQKVAETTWNKYNWKTTKTHL